MARPVTHQLATAQSAILTGIFRAVGDDVTAALGGDDRPLTPMEVNAALRVADARLDALFGAYPGDTTAVLYRLIRASVDRARFAPLNDAVRVWRAWLPPAIWKRLNEEAAS